ncbi:MAG: mechanosensitive ion channel domain-containing protein [Pseudomonadota bacterium]
MTSSFFMQYPEIFAAIVALLGFGAATLASRFVEWLMILVQRGVRRLSPLRADQLASIAPRVFLRRVVYYATLIFFLLLAVRILGIGALTEWLDLILAYIPQLLLGGIIILIGYLLGMMTHGFVSSLTDGALLPRMAQSIVVVTAVMTGLAQMSIDVSFIENVMIVLITVILSGMSLAFALGSRELVANMVSRRALARYRVGDVIRVGDTQGTIIEFTRTGVALESTEGVVTIPALRFLTGEVVLLKP